MEILLVGLNLGDRKTLEKVATKCGHSLDSANSGIDALKKVSRKQIDLILLNTSIPDIKGYALIARIKKLLPKSKIIVAAESNFSELDTADKEEKIDYYLIKPFDEDYLENILNNISSKLG